MDVVLDISLLHERIVLTFISLFKLHLMITIFIFMNYV